MLAAQIVVLAKQPRAGQVKTRLTPALSPQQAAGVAAACLQDTMDAVRSTAVAQRVLVLEGSAVDLDVAGFVVQPQASGGLDVRLAQAFRSAYDASPLPVLLIGMDTPQVTPALLTAAVEQLLAGPGAVLGLAEDGGWWAMGLHQPQDDLLVGVPMSSPDTGVRQRERLATAGLAVEELPVLRDVDRIADLMAVAGLAPSGRVAALVAGLAAAA